MNPTFNGGEIIIELATLLLSNFNVSNATKSRAIKYQKWANIGKDITFIFTLYCRLSLFLLYL